MVQTPMPTNPGPEAGLSAKAKLFIGLVVVLALVIAVLVLWDKRKNEEAAGLIPAKQMADKKAVSEKMVADESDQTPLAELPPIAKTGNVDAVVDGITADLEADTSVAAEGDSDVDYINDGASLMNTEGVYNENEF